MKSRAAIYCRLSKEDINKGENDDYSESIKNQEAMLVQYAKEHDFQVVRIYRDDDYSGLYDDRPGFEKLIQDGRDGLYDTIIVKTQSRFTRNVEHLEKYIHNEFVQWGIRFIGVVDHVDTAVRGNKKARQINGLINEWYCEDLSANVKASYRIKQLSGQYMAPTAPYGYIKDPQDNHHLIPDEYAANVVRHIFSLYLSGLGKAGIARKLSEEGILRPGVYKREVLGLNYYNPHECPGDARWNYQTVAGILRDEVYLGHTIQNKCVTVSYKSKRKKKLPEHEWIKVEHTHEPIVDEMVFQMAQEEWTNRTVPVKIKKNVTLFSGKLFCADCKKAFTKGYTKGASRKRYYVCKTYKAHGNLICSSHKIMEDDLKEIVSGAIREAGRQILKKEEIERLEKFELKGMEIDLNDKRKEIEIQLEKTLRYKARLYEDYADGLLSRTEYLELKKKYEQRESGLRAEMTGLEVNKKEKENSRKNSLLKWVETFKNYMEIDELNREVVEELVDRIEVHEEATIDIYFRFHP